MFTHEWVQQNFGEAEWLGAGGFGEAWKIEFEGHPATLKLTGSHAEMFCVESVKNIQSNQPEYDPAFPFPYILGSGLLPRLEYDSEWYKQTDEYYAADVAPGYFYIREYANLPPPQEDETWEEYDAAEAELVTKAREIYQQYGLILFDFSGKNWGYVDRGEESVMVLTDLACGTPEYWWDEEDQITPVPYGAPAWL